MRPGKKERPGKAEPPSARSSATELPCGSSHSVTKHNNNGSRQKRHSQAPMQHTAIGHKFNSRTYAIADIILDTTPSPAQNGRVVPAIV